MRDPQGPRDVLLADLRGRIHALERGRRAQTSARSLPGSPAIAGDVGGWTLGAPAVDFPLAHVLDPASLHEIKPDVRAGPAAAHWAAAFGFTLRLALRRMQVLQPRAGEAQILWCVQSALARELGLPYGPGLARLGIEPSSLLLVETGRAADTLWALEEGLKSQSLALVVGVLADVALTPARRLSLAAAAHLCPCLLVTAGAAPPAAATATRWRVAPCAGAPHPCDSSAPGATRYSVALERCRDRERRSSAQLGASFLVEWSDETHRFRLASAVAHRADAPRRARRSA